MRRGWFPNSNTPQPVEHTKKFSTEELGCAWRSWAQSKSILDRRDISVSRLALSPARKATDKGRIAPVDMCPDHAQREEWKRTRRLRRTAAQAGAPVTHNRASSCMLVPNIVGLPPRKNQMLSDQLSNKYAIQRSKLETLDHRLGVRWQRSVLDRLYALPGFSSVSICHTT